MTRRTTHTLVFAVAILAGALTRAGAQPPATAALAGLDARIERALSQWSVPGVAVGVVRGDQVLFAEGFGVRELGQPGRIDTHTLFQVASLTKAFTAAAVGQLVDAGKVQWDEPISRYLTGFRVADPWITAHATVRDALAHRTGVDAPNFAVTGQSAQQVVEHGRHAGSVVPYGTYFYSNLLYADLGAMITEVAGMTPGEFVQSHLLTPLGMSASAMSAYAYWDARDVVPCFDCPDFAAAVPASHAHTPDVAMPHWRDGDRVRLLSWRSIDNAPGAGALVASLDDMLKWVSFNLGDGRSGAARVLSAATQHELHTPQVIRHDDPEQAWIWDVVRDAGVPTEQGMYALGWVYDHYREQPYVSHGGGMLGMYCYVAMLPDSDLGVVVLTNGNEWGLQFALTFTILDRLLGKPEVDWIGRFLAAARAREQADRDHEASLLAGRSRLPQPQSQSLPLDSYTGDYFDPVLGPLHVSNEARKLVLQLPGGTSGWLEHWYRDAFRLHWSGGSERKSFVTFQVDAQGRVTGLSDEILGSFARTTSAGSPGH